MASEHAEQEPTGSATGTSDAARPASGDTTSEAAAVQARLYAEMKPVDRMRAAFELSAAVRAVARAGLERRSEGLSDEEIRSRMIQVCYGVDTST